MRTWGILVAGCVGLWLAASPAHGSPEIMTFAVCVGCDTIVPPDASVDPDDRAKVDKAFKEALDSRTIRSAVGGRVFMDRRRIVAVQLWSRTTHLATADRQADGTYKVVKLDGARAAAESQERPPRWHVYTGVDQVDGAKTEIMSARSEKGDGLVSVRCSANKTDLHVDWGHGVAGKFKLIHWRLDNGPLSLEDWPNSPSGRTSFAPQAIPLLKQMLKAGEFSIGSGAYSKAEERLSFKLAGLEDSIAPIRRACSDWTSPPPLRRSCNYLIDSPSTCRFR